MKPMFAAIFVVVCASGTMWTQRLLPSEAELQHQIQKYEQLTHDNPRDVEFWHILGGLYREAERWDKAIAAETQAIQRHLKYAVAFYGRGKARMGKEDYSNAVQDFTSAIKLFEARGGLQLYLTLEQPSDEYVDCYRTRGVALAHLNKYAEGIADVSTAVKLHKDDPKLLYDRGYLEEKADRKKDAVRDYYRAGMVYADSAVRDSSAREQAQECVARLDGLGAKEQADSVRQQLIPKKPKTDLPK